MAGGLRRRHHWHAPAKGTGPAFALSLLAHALLFLSIAFVVQWKTEPVGTVSAELWGGLPAPAPVVEPPPPRPAPKLEPLPEPPALKPDIAIEPTKIEPKKIEPPKKVEPPKKEEPKKIAPPKRVEPVAKPEPPKVDRDAQKRREEELQRIAAAAGATAAPTAGAASGAAGGMSDSYRGQVISCIRPRIVFSVPDSVRPKQHVAEFEVQLLPTGEQAGAPKLLKASGLAAYDQAVERAIRHCDPFPRPKDGALPRTVRLTFDPVDTR
jgi:colicin import membrane protein